MVNATRKLKSQLLVAKVREIENRHGSVSAADVSQEMLDKAFGEFRDDTKPAESKPRRQPKKPMAKFCRQLSQI